MTTYYESDKRRKIINITELEKENGCVFLELREKKWYYEGSNILRGASTTYLLSKFNRHFKTCECDFYCLSCMFTEELECRRRRQMKLQSSIVAPLKQTTQVTTLPQETNKLITTAQ